MSVEKWWNEISGKGKREKTCPEPVSSTTKPTWSDGHATAMVDERHEAAEKYYINVI